MASEDESLESYAELQERQIRAKLADLTPAIDTECEDCGDEIPPLRKAAAPWTKRCVSCQDLEDKKQRTHRR